MGRRKFDVSQLPPAPNLAFEKKRWVRGESLVAGVDEAGRGALAGPVCAAAVILPHDREDLQTILEGVNDSKQISAQERADWFVLLPKISVTHGIGFATSKEIDQFGIIPATQMAIRRALLDLDPTPDHLLVDYIKLPQIPIPQTSLVKGDARSLSIAAASILAKHARDARMLQFAEQYPGYSLASNKGYGTEAHIDAIFTHGPTEIHRHTFSPLKPRAL
jgi:ribonuclease HII